MAGKSWQSTGKARRWKMGKNKWLERARVYDALEEKGYSHLMKKIENGISNLKSLANGGEEQGADAYLDIVKNASPKHIEKTIDLVNEYIEVSVDKLDNRYGDGKWHVGLYAGSYANSVLKSLSFPDRVCKKSLDRCTMSYNSHFNDTGEAEISILSKVMDKIPEKYQENLVDEVFDNFKWGSGERAKSIAKAYDSIFSLPAESQETAMEHYAQFRKNDSDDFSKSTKLAESYILLHKAFGKKLPEKMTMVKKLADVLGYDIAIQRAHQMAAEEVEKSVK